MIATSTAAMFGLMYLNTYRLDHVFFSETRLAFMADMYVNRRVNLAIFAGSAIVFA